MSDFKNTQVVDHPLLQHLLTELRDKNTSSSEFRRLMSEASRFLVYETIRKTSLGQASIETPMEKVAKAPKIDEDLLVVSIMRAGNVMLEAAMQMLPFAHAGHIGIYRDKFVNSTVEYFLKLPSNISNYKVLLLDPLLATGDTAVAAVQRLKDYGAKEIHYVGLLASPQGLQKLSDQHGDVSVHCLSIERELDPKGYLLPGIGDAGDRLYGTFHDGTIA